MDIANTILAQLGGGRFIAMTGAKNFVGGSNSDGLGFLRFKVPATLTRGRVNLVNIVLTASDDYLVETFKNGRRYCTMVQSSDAFADNLRAVFTDLTGLDTSL